MDENRGGFRRTRYRGLDRTDPAAPIKIGVVATACNLVRMAKLLVSPPRGSVGQASCPAKGLPGPAVPG